MWWCKTGREFCVCYGVVGIEIGNGRGAEALEGVCGDGRFVVLQGSEAVRLGLGVVWWYKGGR